MTLQNLLQIGQLDEHETDVVQVRKMIEASARCLADAREITITPETRLDAAYRAITQLCMVALWANGYRTSKNRPGHHQTMIQSLVHSVDLDKDQVALLDVFRVKRNAIDYTGADVDEGSVEACIEAAENLLHHVTEWLARNKPEFVSPAR